MSIEQHTLPRRAFLKWAGGISLAALAPGLSGAFAPAGAASGRVLVLVELKGGNDGLNTVIPYSDPLYAQLRPRLALEREAVLAIDEKLGLHPALEPLRAGWSAGDLAILLGVGYPDPNRSHFRSIEIWETGSDSETYLGEGWLARVLDAMPRAEARLAEGAVLDNGAHGPLGGGKIRSLSMGDPEGFERRARRIELGSSKVHRSALDHMLEVEQDLRHAADGLRARLEAAPRVTVPFPNHAFGRQAETTARLIAARTGLVVFKLSLGSFDTHANQEARHRTLLTQLAEGLAALRAALVEAGRWNDVLVMTYSEFGRRAAQNGSQGTDHGTAAPHFMLGGRVRGGLVGEQPRLDRLEGQDLVHTVDYRQVYRTVADGLWGLGEADPRLRGYRPLDIFRS